MRRWCAADRQGHAAAIVLWIAGALLAVGWWQVRQIGDLQRGVIPFLGWYALLFLGFTAITAWAVRRYARPGASDERAALGAVLCWALLFRLLLLPLVPTLSDDIYRYLWDGRVQLAGLNPYRYAPADPALVTLRDHQWSFINHPAIATIYPPLAQWTFRLAAWVQPTLLSQKIAFLLWDVATMILLVRVLPAWHVSPVLALVYAWHPLVITEFAASGHNDALGIFWLLLGLWLWMRRRRSIAAVAWGLGALGKVAPAMMGLWLLADRSRRRPLGWLLLTVGLGYALFLPGMGRATMGMNHYGGHWEFNSSFYAALVWVVGQPWVARTLCLAAWSITALLLARRQEDPRRFAWTMIALLLLGSPVVEPWYVTWLVPLLCLYRSGAWLYFTGAVMLSYEVLACYAARGVWRLEPWAQWLEYLPLYLWLAVAWWRRRRAAQA